MKITKKYLFLSSVLLLLLQLTHISASENPQLEERDQAFIDVCNQEKKRIMGLDEYELARTKFTSFLNEIEEFKIKKIEEMRNDQEYQKNFAAIKAQIQQSGIVYRQNNSLTNAECAHLVYVLTKQFIPE
jgi:hypothetical protein